MVGAREEMVSSTRSLRPDWRGLRSAETSTSILIAFGSNFPILASFAVACLRNRSSTSVCRPLKMMSTQEPPSARTCVDPWGDDPLQFPAAEQTPLRVHTRHPPGRPGLRPHIRLLRGSQPHEPLLPFSLPWTRRVPRRGRTYF